MISSDYEQQVYLETNYFKYLGIYAQHVKTTILLNIT